MSKCVDKELIGKAGNLLRWAINRWPEYDTDEEDEDAASISGSEMVEWFAEFREECVSLLSEIEDERRACNLTGHPVP